MIKHSPGALESLENVKLAWVFLLSSYHPYILRLGEGRKEESPVFVSVNLADKRPGKQSALWYPRENDSRDWASGWGCSQDLGD